VCAVHTWNAVFQFIAFSSPTPSFSSKQIHSAYAVVLCTVMEQVAFFPLTEYPPDGRSKVELDFDQHLLQFDKRGGFLLKLQKEDGSVDEALLQMWMQRIKSLSGPKLLDRGPSKGEDDDGSGDADHGVTEKSTGPSFQSDRRIIRLIIARYWADLLLKKYYESLKTTQGIA
jgi:hypothetical protein